VRVIAKDGKFLGDDIGGALVTLRDAQTKELLAEGITSGGSGLNGPGGVMCAILRRGEPLPTTGASEYTAHLQLDRPRRIEITAYGPLGALQSAMMCGCPISYEREQSAIICPELPDDQQPWLPDEFQVAAVVRGQSGAPLEIPLRFMDIPPADRPGQFAGVWSSPPQGIYEITVYAYQKMTGNTGVDVATFIASGPSSNT
jgi:hypothetical protein